MFVNKSIKSYINAWFNNSKLILRCKYSTQDGESSSDTINHIYRYNYTLATECQVNKQIGSELFASQTYLSMASHFSRTDIGLVGSAGFFLKMSDEERGHALKWINYQNSRGGVVQLDSVPQPEHNDWKSLMFALMAALQLERTVTDSIMDLYRVAEENKDIILMDYISAEFLHDQMNDIQALGMIIARLNAAGGESNGNYWIDKELAKRYRYDGEICTWNKEFNLALETK